MSPHTRTLEGVGGLDGGTQGGRAASIEEENTSGVIRAQHGCPLGLSSDLPGDQLCQDRSVDRGSPKPAWRLRLPGSSPEATLGHFRLRSWSFDTLGDRCDESLAVVAMNHGSILFSLFFVLFLDPAVCWHSFPSAANTCPRTEIPYRHGRSSSCSHGVPLFLTPQSRGVVLPVSLTLSTRLILRCCCRPADCGSCGRVTYFWLRTDEQLGSRVPTRRRCWFFRGVLVEMVRTFTFSTVVRASG